MPTLDHSSTDSLLIDLERYHQHGSTFRFKYKLSGSLTNPWRLRLATCTRSGMMCIGIEYFTGLGRERNYWLANNWLTSICDGDVVSVVAGKWLTQIYDRTKQKLDKNLGEVFS